MSIKKYLGQVQGGKGVYISPNSPNQHVIISGISGSGKSYRIEDMEQRIVEEGGTVLVIDINGTHSVSSGRNVNFISAVEDGLNLDLFDCQWVESGKETNSNLISYVIETLCPKKLRGVWQIAAVREAVEFAIRHRMEFPSDVAAIAAGLKGQNTQAAMGAYNHLYDVFEGNIFRHSPKHICPGMINVISLKGINPQSQKRISEIFLCILWRKMRMTGKINGECTLVIDEFQILDFEQGTALFQMLTEARKYNLSLILATQTFTIFSEKQRVILNQASVKLFFQQEETDIKKIASLIGGSNKYTWETVLKRLRIGESIAIGKLQFNGRDVSQPLIIRSSESVCSSQYAIQKYGRR